MKILQYSIERSGSTLITQVLRKLFPHANVHKIHTFHKNIGCPVVTTYRDFRDVMVSRWRVREDIPFAELDNGRIMTPDELDMYLDITVRGIETFNRMCKEHGDNLMALKYEVFIDDYDYIFRELERFFNISLDEKLKQDIKQYSNVEANAKRAKVFSSFHNGNWDKETLIHGLHIYKGGRPGIWKKLVPANKHECVNSCLSDYLWQWGYKT